MGNSLSLVEYENARQNDNTIYTFATNYLDEILKNRNYVVNKISEALKELSENLKFSSKTIDPF